MTISTQPAADAAAAYLDAWNAHDGSAVAALVHGTYIDPVLPEPISGAALAGYVDTLCAAFPDLHFAPAGTHVSGDTVVTQWQMKGTNDGAALPGAPMATNETIDLPGIDVITVVDGAIRSVAGYFDRQAFMEQLGLQLIPAPKDEWPVTSGVARRVDLGNTTTPGAISLTWIELRDMSELAELSARTQEIIAGLAGDPAFVGFDSAGIGNRFYTLTAWTSPEAAEAALARSRAHTAAVDRVVTERGIGAGGFTSIWQPYRLNPQFHTCPSCRAYVPIPLGSTAATCPCGGEVNVTPYV
jgi:steroid delta-isomerase-like uncharacterized protein